MQKAEAEMTPPPWTVEIIRTHVAGLVQQAQEYLFRSAYSTIVRESRDYSCAVLNRDGGVVAATAQPLHLGVYPRMVQRVLADYGEKDILPGDCFLSNHPYYAGVPHVSDVVVVTPVFSSGELVAWTGTIAHKADVGGMTAGSVSGQTTELYQEGVIIPPIKWLSTGKRSADLDKVFMNNVRSPELVGGDIATQVGVCHLGKTMLEGLLTRYGRETVVDSFEEILLATQRRLTKLVKQWGNGTARVAGQLENDGVNVSRPVGFRLLLAVSDGSVHFDFTGSDPQTLGPVNLRQPLLESSCGFALIAMTDPTIDFNDGVRRVFRITSQPGTVVDALPPASVSSYIRSVYVIVDLMFEALARFSPSRAIAPSGNGGSVTFVYPSQRVKRSYVQYEILAGGFGGRKQSDGISGISVHMSNLSATPVEIIETEFPVRVERFELVKDSGGPGLHRGGLGIRRAYRTLAPATVVRRAGHIFIGPPGVEGGQPGKVGSCRAVLGGEGQEKAMPVPGKYDLPSDTLITFEGSGGGGYGNPLRRDPSAVRADVLQGYVSPEAARSEYGVVLEDSTGEIDWKGTALLRASEKRTNPP